MRKGSFNAFERHAASCAAGSFYSFLGSLRALVGRRPRLLHSFLFVCLIYSASIADAASDESTKQDSPPQLETDSPLFEVHPQFDLLFSLLGSRHLGGEARIGAVSSSLTRKLLDRALMIGPSLGVQVASGQYLRVEFVPGFGAQFFVLNVMGLGVEMDLVVPLGGTTSSGLIPLIRPRAAFIGTLRFIHLKDDGAIGARWAVHHDFHEGLGVQLGVTLQLNGVP